MSSKKNKKSEQQTADSFDMVNKYGTYNVQATNGTENEFPQIAQGTPKSKNKKSKNNK